jgi:hypothetical protein
VARVRPKNLSYVLAPMGDDAQKAPSGRPPSTLPPCEPCVSFLASSAGTWRITGAAEAQAVGKGHRKGEEGE